jgi:hypothetical protein
LLAKDPILLLVTARLLEKAAWGYKALLLVTARLLAKVAWGYKALLLVTARLLAKVAWGYKALLLVTARLLAKVAWGYNVLLAVKDVLDNVVIFGAITSPEAVKELLNVNLALVYMLFELIVYIISFELFPEIYGELQ